MPYQTLRFIHAARALVDCPLRDIGAIDPELRSLARDATTLAFRKLITDCVDHEVDFLLLTGDSLKQSDFSVRALVELREGFELLDDAGIQVFVVPGALDPASAWDAFPDWPNNVTIFRPESDDPVAVLRDGSVIASIRALAWRRSWFAWDDESPSADRAKHRVVEADGSERANTDSAANESTDVIPPARSDSHRETRRVQSPSELRPNHFAIAIVRDGIDAVGENPQADYLAVVGDNERNTIKGADWLLHFPGATQGLSADEHDLHGCSIIDLDSDGVIRCAFLATAPVRWENVDVVADDETTLHDLHGQMRAACEKLFGLEEIPVSRPDSMNAEPTFERGCLVSEFGDAVDDASSSGSQVREAPAVVRVHEPIDIQADALFLRWTIRGQGAFFDSLQQASRQAELRDWLDSELDWPAGLRIWHRFRLMSIDRATSVGTSGQSTDDGEQIDVPTEFFWRVDQGTSVGAAAWSDLGDESSVERSRLARVQTVVPDADATVVFSHARRRGWSWFGNRTEQEPIVTGPHTEGAAR